MSTTGQRDGCTLTVHTKIEFEDATAGKSAKLGERVPWWQSELEAIWDNGGEGWQELACQVRFTFELRERAGGATAGWHQIEIVDWPFRSWSSIGPASGEGVWSVYTDEYEAAHEVGHLMGLPVDCPGSIGQAGSCDEYTVKVLADGTVVYDQNLHEQTTDPQCIMAQVWKPAAVVPPHVSEVLQLVGLSCPPRCIFRRPWDWLLRRRRWRPIPRPPAREFPFRDLPERTPRALLDTVDVTHPMTLSLVAHELARRGDEVVDGLLESARDGPPLQRIPIALALQAVGLDDERTIPVLESMVASTDVGLRLHAAAALARRGRATGREVLERARELDVVVAGHPPARASDLARRMLESLGEVGEVR